MEIGKTIQKTNHRWKVEHSFNNEGRTLRAEVEAIIEIGRTLVKTKGAQRNE